MEMMGLFFGGMIIGLFIRMIKCISYSTRRNEDSEWTDQFFIPRKDSSKFQNRELFSSHYFKELFTPIFPKRIFSRKGQEIMDEKSDSKFLRPRLPFFLADFFTPENSGFEKKTNDFRRAETSKNLTLHENNNRVSVLFANPGRFERRTRMLVSLWQMGCSYWFLGDFLSGPTPWAKVPLPKVISHKLILIVMGQSLLSVSPCHEYLRPRGLRPETHSDWD